MVTVLLFCTDHFGRDSVVRDDVVKGEVEPGVLERQIRAVTQDLKSVGLDEEPGSPHDIGPPEIRSSASMSEW